MTDEPTPEALAAMVKANPIGRLKKRWRLAQYGIQVQEA